MLKEIIRHSLQDPVEISRSTQEDGGRPRLRVRPTIACVGALTLELAKFSRLLDAARLGWDVGGGSSYIGYHWNEKLC